MPVIASMLSKFAGNSGCFSVRACRAFGKLPCLVGSLCAKSLGMPCGRKTALVLRGVSQFFPQGRERYAFHAFCRPPFCRRARAYRLAGCRYSFGAAEKCSISFHRHPRNTARLRSAGFRFALCLKSKDNPAKDYLPPENRKHLRKIRKDFSEVLVIRKTVCRHTRCIGSSGTQGDGTSAVPNTYSILRQNCEHLF